MVGSGAYTDLQMITLLCILSLAAMATVRGPATTPIRVRVRRSVRVIDRR